MFLLYWRPRTGHYASHGYNLCWVEGKDHLPWPAAVVFPHMLFTFFGGRAHHCLMGNLSTRTPRSYSAKLLSRFLVSSTYWLMWLFLLKCRTWHFPLLNFTRFSFAHFSSLVRPLQMATQPSGMNNSSQFCIICKLWRCTLTHYLGHWWRCQTAQVSFFSHWSRKGAGLIFCVIGCTALFFPPVYKLHCKLVLNIALDFDTMSHRLLLSKLWTYSSRSCSVKVVQAELEDRSNRTCNL